MEQIIPSTPSPSDLKLDQQTISYLGEAARWARFLSILGFIMCGLLILGGVFVGSFMAGAFSSHGFGMPPVFGGGFFAVIYIGIAILYFFPCLYLFHFGSKMRSAIQKNDPETLSVSFKNLKSCLRFCGIMAIVVLAFYALALIAGVIGAAASH